MQRGIFMPLYYITGLSGSGKSTLHSYLKSLGYTAVDGDEGICNWHSTKTGEQASSPITHTLEWLAEHQWLADRAKVASLRLLANHQPVFLCGTSMNDEDFLDLVDDVFFLEMDEYTLRQRLANRTTSNWGKHPDELLFVLLNMQRTETLHRACGSHFIPAILPVHEIAEQILQACNLASSGYALTDMPGLLAE